MLSTGAFNALLKTLEEPPEHAIFILATTEVYKVPITILSRCQRYDFKKIEKNKMITYLKEICEKENIEYDPEIFEEIYTLSDGCMRDALSIIDQVSKINNKLTMNILEKNYSLISNKDIYLLLDSINSKNINLIIEKINEYKETGVNAQKLIKKIIVTLEEIAINIKTNKEDRYDFNKVIKLIKSLDNCYAEARINENIYTLIKIAFLELIDDKNGECINIQKKENISKPVIEANNKIENKQIEKYDLIQIRINNCFSEANKESLNKFKEIGKKIKNININGLNLNEYDVVAASEKYIIVVTEEESLADLFNIKVDEVEKIFNKKGYNIKIVALNKNRWNKEKNIYINNIKNNIQYKFIEEPLIEDGNKIIKEKINQIFENEKIEIN